MAEDKFLTVDITPLNINGVIHIGADHGNLARHYHRLGVHTVLWFEKRQEKYVKIYEHTRNFGMNQSIVMKEIKGPGSNSFLQHWRETAAFMNIYDYDMINIDCSVEPVAVIGGFDFLLERVRAIVVRAGNYDEVNKFMDSKGYRLDQFTEREYLFVKKD